MLQQSSYVRKEAKDKFLAHFMVDRHQKIIGQGEIKLNTLEPPLHDSTISNFSGNQSILHLMELQQDQVEHRIDRIEETLKKLTCALEKSIVPSFPSHDVDTENVLNTSATIQSQPLYGMSMNSYQGQSLPPPHLMNVATPLGMVKPSAYNLGPSDPIPDRPMTHCEPFDV